MLVSGGFLRALLRAVPLSVANAADAAEVMALSMLLPFVNSRLLGSGGISGSAVATAVFAGMLLGGLFGGILADFLGRRKVILVALFLGAAGSALSAFLVLVLFADWGQSTLLLWLLFLLVRGVIGVLVGAQMPATFSLAVETTAQRMSGAVVSLVQSGWMLGSVFVATVGVLLLSGLSVETVSPESGGNDDDTSFFLALFVALCAMPALMGAILVCLFLPESPKWLLKEGRAVEAAAVMRRLMLDALPQERAPREDTLKDVVSARDEADPLISPRAEAVNSSEGDASPRPHATRKDGDPQCISGLAGLPRQLFADLRLMHERDPAHTRAFVLLAVVWFSLSWAYYGTSTWIVVLLTDLGDDDPYLTALMFAGAALPGNIFAVVGLDRIGRKIFLGGSLLGAGAAMILVKFSPRTGAILFNAVLVGAYNSLNALSTELFPVVVRSTVFAMLGTFGRIASILAQIANGFLQTDPLRLLVVNACLLALAAGTVPFLPRQERLRNAEV